ncbi:MBL fold metallo-hydrolase [Microbacterium sp. SYP-A9085]|uniref:MBL fold metallo-hydrolase n=1 Tax=Microbacterium sp. SYP-A9085 TaxID=2664454 RepID=UPI0034648621
MIEPTDPVQFRAWRQQRVPEAGPIRDGVHSFPLPMPSGTRLTHSFCYAVEDDRGGIHLIDTGMSGDQNADVLAGHLRGIGRSTADVATVTVTHLHPDHIGLADHVHAASGATVLLHDRDRQGLATLRARGHRTDPDTLAQWGVPADRAAAMLAADHRDEGPLSSVPTSPAGDGDVLPIPGRRLEVIHTPGHTAGHICILDADTGLLFTGDHVLPTIHGGIGLGGQTDANPIAEYLGGLERLAPYADLEVAPGHEYRFRGLAQRLHTTAEHHLRRTREVAAALRADPDLSVWDVAMRLTWSAGWANLAGFYLLSALSQTAMHRSFVQSGRAARWLQSDPLQDAAPTR